MTFEHLLDHDACFVNAYATSLNDSKLISLLEYIHELDLNGKNIEIFNKLLLNKKMQNRLKLLGNQTIINYLPINILNIVLKDDYFKSLFLSLKINEINKLVEGGLIIPYFFIQDDDFIRKYLDVASVQERRFYVNNLIKNNYSIYEILGNKLNDLDDEEVNNSLNEFEKLLKINDIKMAKQIFSKRIFELLIDRYFFDFVYNIKINMKMLIDFISKIDEKIISSKRLYWYYLFLNFENKPLERQIEIYKIIPKDISEWLYEDFRSCQNYAYNLINQNILDLNKLQSEEKDDVIIYKLNGEDFLLPVHVTEYAKGDANFLWNKKSDIKTLSISLIGSKCLGLYRNPKEWIVVGFNKLNTNDIMHMYHTDSYSHGEYSTDKVNEIYTPKDFLSKTFNYNEILIAQNILNNKKLVPSYLVCYDEVTDDDIKVSQGLKVPIILIMTKCYSKKDSFYFDHLDDHYVTNLDSLFVKEIGEKQKMKKV